MSGHSKWAQIKRQKGVTDTRRGQLFTKLAAAITIAVRDGGGVTDPSQNFKLRLAVEKARSVNMPKENVKRAIDRGVGKGEKGEGLQEVVYEGFGPGGVAVIADAVTDNKQRTTPEVKSVFDKHGGTLATPGAVSYQFQLKGLISVAKNGKSSDDFFLIAADAGAEDVEEAGEEVLIYTKPEEVGRVKEHMVSQGISVIDFELTRKPITTVRLEEKELAWKVLDFIDKLENLDDIQKVYSNFDIPDTVLNT